MDQNVINILMGIAGTIAGFLLNIIWQAVKDLQNADKEIIGKVGEIEVLVAGAYVRKDELSALFGKLDRIENKITIVKGQ